MHLKRIPVPQETWLLHDTFRLQTTRVQATPFCEGKEEWNQSDPSNVTNAGDGPITNTRKTHGGHLPVPLPQDGPGIFMSFLGICSGQSWSCLQCPYTSNHAIVLILGFSNLSFYIFTFGKKCQYSNALLQDSELTGSNAAYNVAGKRRKEGLLLVPFRAGKNIIGY